MIHRSRLALLALCAAATTSCTLASPTVVGSGHPATQQRDVDSFTRVEVSDSIRATVIVGPDASIAVTADDNVLGNVETSALAGRLKLAVDGNVQTRTPIEIAVTVPSLDAISATSSASVIVTGLDSASFRASSSSSASLVVRGNADSVDVSASSSGSADAGDVPAQNATVKVSSSATATVNAQLSVSGSVDSGGVVTIEGQPASVDVSTDSGGTVVHD